AASTLASAAEQLSRLVANLKLEGDAVPAAADEPPRVASHRPTEPRPDALALPRLPEPALA
ncbi:MAG: hypothetical protein ABIU76_07405, partial [Gemmatimonadaceae bacterium]